MDLKEVSVQCARDESPLCETRVSETPFCTKPPV